MSRAVRYKKHLTTLQVFLSIVLILLTACVAVKAFFLKAPEQKVDELPSQPSSTGDPQLSEEEQAAQKALRSHLERKGGFYTILVSGSDDGNGNSDTNILVAVDTVNGYVYGVSIPRDSKAVWDGKSHKINAAFGKGGMTKLAEVVSDQLGIPVDYTVSVDLTGFEALVEAIGACRAELPERRAVPGQRLTFGGRFGGGSRRDHVQPWDFLLLCTLVFFSGGDTAPDVSLGLVHVQHLLDLQVQRPVKKGQPF